MPAKRISHAKPIHHTHPNSKQVTKIDAVREQLDCAIEYYFLDAYPLASHTLLCAALGVCDPLLKARGKPNRETELESVRPEFRHKVRNMLASPGNFFKHGSNDPMDSIGFNSDINVPMLLQVYCAYRQLGFEATPRMVCLMRWMKIWHTGYFIGLESNHVLREAHPLSTKKEFYSLTIAALRHQYT